MDDNNPGGSNNSARPDGDEAEDQRWFELMAGRAAPDAQPGTRVDAAWLRAAMLAYQPAPPAGAMPPAEARAERLVQRAVAAGVLPPRPAAGTDWARQAAVRLKDWLTGSGQGPSRQPLRWAAGMAVVVLAAAAVLQLALPGHEKNGPDGSGPDNAAPDGGASVERGASRQQLVADDPEAEQQALLQALRAAGVDAQPYQRLGRLGVDAELPVPLPPAVAAVLRAHGLRPPGGPALAVEISGRSAAGAPAVPR